MKNFLLNVFIGLTCLFCTGCFQHRLTQIESAANDLKKNPADQNALNTLVRFLDDNDAYLRAQAVIALGNLGDSHASALGPKVVPLLVKGLKDNGGAVRRNAVLALSHYKSFAPLAVTNLIEIISKFPSHDSSWFAADLLGDIGTNAVIAVPALVVALNYRPSGNSGYENMLSEHAAEALYKISPYASDTSPQLNPILKSLNGHAKLYSSLAALRKNQQNPVASESIAEVLQSDDAGLVISALRELQNLDVKTFGNPLIPAIIECSNHTNVNISTLARKINSDTRAGP